MKERVLKGIEPERVFHYFEEISAIPHGSTDTKRISDYCVSYAKEHGFEYYQDSDNNVIIIKPASSGREQEEPIIMQGHIDMVCEVEPGITKDMTKEALDLFVDGDLIGARHTTLGGDDGIAVAMALAIMDDDSLSHPRLEALLTVDEEIGMLGAVSVDVSPLKGHVMLNIDSEEEGIFTVSCAGGVVAECIVPVLREESKGNTYEIYAKGLTGGHSGIEINKGRATANKTVAMILKSLKEKVDFRIVSIDGGLKDNAIPVASKGIIVTEAGLDELKAVVDEIAGPIISKHKETDPSMEIGVCEVKVQMLPASAKSTEDILDVFYNLPEGIQKMSEGVEGLVQTSLNMGILTTTETQVSLKYCVRSSVDREKNELVAGMNDLVKAHGGHMILTGDYSGWEYRPDSPLRDTLTAIYKEQYGKDVKIEAIHAGVECGVLAGKINDLDCVSYGPNLTEIHTYRERMSISSVARVYKMTRTIIEKGINA